MAEESIFSCCCFFHWSHHHPPFVTSELVASGIIMISQTEDYDLQMRKAQWGGQIPKQQPSDICEIFAKMSLQFKKKNEGERAGGKHPKNIISRMSCQPVFFFPKFSIWCPGFSNLSHLVLMNMRRFFSMPYVLWSLGKKMHPNNLFFMFWFYPIIIYILHSLMPICNVFTIRKGNKKGREKT